jgi:hypothetical protein
LTRYGQKYISTQTIFINPPLFYNASWPDGLMFNFSIAMERNNSVENVCALYRALLASLRQTNLRIGNTELRIAAEQPDLCPDPTPVCGVRACNAALGEVCLGAVCGCPTGRKRAGDTLPCQGEHACVRTCEHCDYSGRSHSHQFVGAASQFRRPQI